MATELEMRCTPDKVRREFTALQAENERLRTALLKVEKNMDIMGGYDGRFTLRKVVRDALKGGE